MENEVVQLDFGHCPVPEECQDVYARKTNTAELTERYQALGQTHKEKPTRQQQARPVEDKQTTSTPPHIRRCARDSAQQLRLRRRLGGPFQELESFPEINQSQRKGRKRIGSFISEDDDTDTEAPTDKTE